MEKVLYFHFVVGVVIVGDRVFYYFIHVAQFGCNIAQLTTKVGSANHCLTQ